MPIFEFKCNKCEDIFELLLMNSDDELELKCPKCNSQEFERVLSSSNYSVGTSGNKKVATQTRKCSGGSCTTYNIPGKE
ncbi:MAG: zinc ribbon domain-containing protein [Desulfobacterales bacterium]|nr:zinc ribbon domain-containing protein [Desulfobacterales bacterium]